MPAILVTILSVFARSLIARMLLGAGLTIFTYNFVDDLVLQAQNEMHGLLNNLPSDIIGLISILKISSSFKCYHVCIGYCCFYQNIKSLLGRAT